MNHSPKPSEKEFLPIRTSSIMLLRGRIIRQKRKSSTHLIVLKTRSGYFYCYFKEDPGTQGKQIISIMGNPFSSNLGTAVNLFQCHVIPYREHQSIVKSIIALLPVETIKRKAKLVYGKIDNH